MLQRLSNQTIAAGVVLAALTIGFASGLTPLQTPPAKNRHIIVISLDGFAAYALADPNLPLPHLRALARAGVMAEAMTGVNPTVTWPNHTSMITGVGPDRHGVLYNGLPVRHRPASGAGEPLKSEPVKSEPIKPDPIKIEAHVDKTRLVLAPTVYDAAHAAGLTTAEVDWVAIEHAPTITWSFSEYGEPQGPVAREMVAAGVITEEELRRFQDAPQPFDDEIWTRAAEHIITAHKPNLLMVHFLATDDIQHKYGARTEAAYTALALADARVGRLVEACRTAGILADTTFVIVSDHGFRTVTHRIRPNVLLRQRSLGSAAWAVPEGGTAIVYATATGADAGDRAKTLEAVKQAFTGVEGIDQVLTPADFAKYGYPAPAQSDRMGELVLAAKVGYAFAGGTDGEAVTAVEPGTTPGTHGYLNTDPDMRAIFIASGAGVRRGATLGVIRNVDVAPTIARWLGVEMANITGQPLTSIIDLASSGSR
jgi:predicted AlkP superfamily pyrophosphatase or phosphodiesterase